jgi:hypothetical protein
MTDAPHHSITTVPLDNLRRSYPTSELLSRPVLDGTGANLGMIADLLMQDDHLAFAILDVGDYSGHAGRRVVVAIDDLSVVDKEFVMAGISREELGRLTVYDPGDVAQGDGLLARRARRGVKDAGHVVTGALGEPLPGTIADVTDGDR